MTTTVGRNLTTVTLGRGPLLRKLRWWQLWARTSSQYEIHLGLYRTWRHQPGNMNCLPSRVVRPLIWAMSTIPAIGDHYGHWLTTGDASVKLRPVNKRHGVLAKVAFFPVAVALFAGFLALGLALRIPPLVALPFLLVVIVPTTIGLFVVADAWNRARLFRRHIDYVSLELVRHHRSPKGSGAEIRDAIHQYAVDSGSIIGGMAGTSHLRDTFYLSAASGRHPDCHHPDRPCDDSDDCRRTIFDPKTAIRPH